MAKRTYIGPIHHSWGLDRKIRISANDWGFQLDQKCCKIWTQLGLSKPYNSSFATKIVLRRSFSYTLVSIFGEKECCFYFYKEFYCRHSCFCVTVFLNLRPPEDYVPTLGKENRAGWITHALPDILSGRGSTIQTWKLKDWLRGLQENCNTRILKVVQKGALESFDNPRSETIRFKEGVGQVV